MRVNVRCAHHLRPPPRRIGWQSLQILLPYRLAKAYEWSVIVSVLVTNFPQSARVGVRPGLRGRLRVVHADSNQGHAAIGICMWIGAA